MRVLDPGHLYEVDVYDGTVPGLTKGRRLFMKRIGDGYPGNEPPAYAGTNCQEELRVLIDRVKYLDGQRPHPANADIVAHLRAALWQFELRHAELRGEMEIFCRAVTERFGGRFAPWVHDYSSRPAPIEELEACKVCGHVLCSVHT